MSPQSLDEEGHWRSTARLRAFVTALAVRTVGAVRHGFYEVELRKKETLCAIPATWRTS